MYRDIIKQSKDGFTNERETNLTAVISQLSTLGYVSVYLLFIIIYRIIYFYKYTI